MIEPRRFGKVNIANMGTGFYYATSTTLGR
jgi:hypothetical protein